MCIFCGFYCFRSDGAQPHLVNIQFQKKVKLQVCFCFFSPCIQTYICIYIYIYIYYLLRFLWDHNELWELVLFLF